MLARSGPNASKSADPIEKLRQLIRRKISEREKLLKEIAECDTALAPLRQRQLAMQTIDGEIHELFRAVLASSKLNKRARAEVRGLYEELQDEQVLSPDPAREAELASLCPCPACSSRDVSEAWFEELDPNDARGEAAPGARPAEPVMHAPQRPAREASVRALYHKLALQFHPDRAEDEALRAEHEAVMRKVNDAYHGGDTERLLDLSRELGIDVGELQESGGLLAELVQQYERIKAEVRDIRNSPVGSLVAEMRRARKHSYGSPIDALDEQAEAALAQLTSVRDFVRDFAQGKISLKVFLKGPPVDAPPGLEEVDEEELLGELMGMLEQLERKVRRTSSASRSSRRGAKT